MDNYDEIRSEAYRKTKAKYDEAFKRELSDIEVAEALNEKVLQLEEDLEAAEEELSEYQQLYKEAVSKLGEEIPSDLRELCNKIKAIRHIPAEEHEITIILSDYETKINVNLKGILDE